MTDKPPDYTTLSGAEFQRAVGADPDKWAIAFIRSVAGEMREAEIIERASHLAPWFRDAMRAALREHGQLLTLGSSARGHAWDKDDDVA